MNKEFTDKVIVITGASRGIGKAIAEYFFSKGAIIVCGVRNIHTLKFSSTIIKSSRFIPIPLDVRQELSIKAFVKQSLDKHNTIDVLINNAGVDEPMPITRITKRHWNYIFDTNVTGLVLTTKYVARKMVEQKSGIIINMSSIAGKEGVPYHSAYVASKHAVIGITKCLARELIPYNIRVNAICPGLINTDMLQNFFNDYAKLTHTNAQDELQKMIELTPRKQMGRPQDVANLIGFLCSKQASNIIGHAINSDGGILQH